MKWFREYGVGYLLLLEEMIKSNPKFGVFFYYFFYFFFTFYYLKMVLYCKKKKDMLIILLYIKRRRLINKYFIDRDEGIPFQDLGCR